MYLMRNIKALGKEAYEESNLKYELIRALIEYRKREKVTQAEPARRIGIPQQAISRLETGKVTPRLDFVEKLLKAMGYRIKLEKVR